MSLSRDTPAPGRDPAVAAVRRAVRTALDALPAPQRAAPLLVACSGGADSMALAAAAHAVAGEGRVHAAVVDHGLQEGSDRHAAATAEALTRGGVIASVHRVDVGGPGGIEAAARRARYAALRAARPHPDSPVLLGHTLDDQAETVLLGLGRGSGPRSLAGMRAWDEPWLRPLLGVRHADTLAACAAQGLPVWEDPHNTDPRFTRVRLRHEVLPLLEEVLAGGVAAALARTATQLREDSDLLDGLAATLLAAALDTAALDPDDAAADADADADDIPGAGGTRPAGAVLRLEPLTGAPPPLRRRALRSWLLRSGVPSLTDAHLRAADDLAARGPDRGGVALPGDLELVRGHGRLRLQPIRWSTGPTYRRTQEDGRCVRR